MSELPAGNVWITAVAYGATGIASEPLSALSWTVAPPPWHAASWVNAPATAWSPAELKYYFSGRVPSAPPLHHQYTVDLVYFGSLRNTFASDIVVLESFRIDGLWTY